MKKMKLEELCTLITDGSHYSPATVEDGYPIASVKDMNDYGINLATTRKIGKNDYKKLIEENTRPQIGDVLIAKDGSYLKHSFVVEDEPEYVVLSSIGIFRPDPKLINPYYLKYVFMNPNFKKYVTNGFVSGTALKRIVLRAFKKININVPSIEKQNEIVESIKNIEDLIKTNNKLIKDIEEFSLLTFHKWFVEFNFPDENGNPYRSNGGVMKKVNGESIPEGWDREKLSDSAEFTNGLAMQKFPPENEEDKLPVIKIREINNEGFNEDTDFITKNINEKLIINDGDILFPWSASLGVYVWMGGKGGLNQHIFKVESEKHHDWFIYHWIKEHMPYFERVAYGKKTTMGHINRRHLELVYNVVPPKDIMTQMHKIIDPLYQKTISLKRENKQLKEMRDLLIYKYVQ